MPLGLEATPRKERKSQMSASRMIRERAKHIGCRLCRKENMPLLLAAVRCYDGKVLGIVVDPEDSQNREVYFYFKGGVEELDDFLASEEISLRYGEVETPK